MLHPSPPSSPHLLRISINAQGQDLHHSAKCGVSPGDKSPANLPQSSQKPTGFIADFALFHRLQSLCTKTDRVPKVVLHQFPTGGATSVNFWLVIMHFRAIMHEYMVFVIFMHTPVLCFFVPATLPDRSTDRGYPGRPSQGAGPAGIRRGSGNVHQFLKYNSAKTPACAMRPPFRHFVAVFVSFGEA